jgi:nucleotidyltransferase substrate binding protein (TIGR01987 family)
MNRTEIILRDLESVLAKLEAALNAPKSDLTRDSAILRFELAFEVSWKAIQKFALAEGFEVNSPRQAFERAFQLGWISDEVLWQQVLLQRNAAVHIYREPLAEVLYNQLRSFLDGFKELLKNLKEKRQAFRAVR